MVLSKEGRKENRKHPLLRHLRHMLVLMWIQDQQP